MGAFKTAWRTFVRGWKAFWLKVAWVQAFVILLVVYLVPLGLTALISYALRRDFLRTRVRGRDTFWIEREPADASVERAERQF